MFIRARVPLLRQSTTLLLSSHATLSSTSSPSTHTPPSSLSSSSPGVVAATETGDPFLLTPGPLTTSKRTKEAMLHDWGSRDHAFIQMNDRVRARLLQLIDASDTHAAVLLQGSGTFAVEATLATLVPRNGIKPFSLFFFFFCIILIFYLV
jgi:hypothetical protein